MNSSDYYANYSFEVENFTAFEEDDLPVITRTREKSALQIFYNIFIFAIFVVGVSANLVICWMLKRKWKMQTSLNIVLLNLAISDIIVCCKIALALFVHEISSNWNFGETSCKLYLGLMSTCYYFESITIYITLYVFTIYPKVNKRNVCFTMLVLWIISLMIGTPRGYYATVYESRFYDESYCVINHNHEKVFTSIRGLIELVLPAVIFGKIMKNYSWENLQDKMKSNRMLFTLVAIFLTLTLPLTVLRNMESFGYYFSYLSIYFAHMASCLMLVYKPFVYILLDEGFRSDFNIILLQITGRTSEESYALYVNDL